MKITKKSTITTSILIVFVLIFTFAFMNPFSWALPGLIGLIIGSFGTYVLMKRFKKLQK